MKAVKEILSHGKHSGQAPRKIEKSRVIFICKCSAKHSRKGQRYCAPCHAAYMREWRKTHALNAEQRAKDAARSYANTYQKRGKLKKTPCEGCGSSKAEKHHPDYQKPLDVVWLCRPCHLALHKKQARESSGVAAQALKVAA